MRVLVTGGAGFIGSHVAEALLRRGDRVTILDNFNDYYDPARKRANVEPLCPSPRCRLIEGDLRDPQTVQRAVEGVDLVIHLAAMAGVRYSIGRAPLYTAVNITGTVNVLEAVRLRGVPQVIFASTSSVYGRSRRLPFREDDPLGAPLAPYPATKIAGELLGYTYHNLHGLNFTALRFFSVYGPRGRPDMMPFIVTDRIVRGQPFTLYEGGEMWRDWTYIDDIVRGILSAADRPLGYRRINLGRGAPVRMADFVRIVERLTGRRAQIETSPAPPSEPPITYADITLARTHLDYEPQIDVEEGMRRFCAWYRETFPTADSSRKEDAE